MCGQSGLLLTCVRWWADRVAASYQTKGPVGSGAARSEADRIKVKIFGPRLTCLTNTALIGNLNLAETFTAKTGCDDLVEAGGAVES